MNSTTRVESLWGKPKKSLDEARDAAFSHLAAFSVAVQRSG
jgi:hypothetical protein